MFVLIVVGVLVLICCVWVGGCLVLCLCKLCLWYFVILCGLLWVLLVVLFLLGFA